MKLINFGIIILMIFNVGINGECANKRPSKKNFEKKIEKIIKAFNEKDGSLNQFIHPETGLYVIFRLGIFDQFQKVNKIDFDYPTPAHWTYPIVDPDCEINYEDLPVYSCVNDKWSKAGLFCDINNQNHLLSQTASNLVKYELTDSISQSMIDTFIELENRSHRVVLVDKMEGEGLIFYLTLINDKWYLTMLDRVSSDCST